MARTRPTTADWMRLGSTVGNAWNTGQAPSMQEKQSSQLTDAPVNQNYSPAAQGYEPTGGLEDMQARLRGSPEESVGTERSPLRSDAARPEYTPAEGLGRGGAFSNPTKEMQYSHKGVSRNTAFSDAEVSSANYKAAKAYWQDKGEFGQTQVKALDSARVADREEEKGGLEMDAARQSLASGKIDLATKERMAKLDDFVARIGTMTDPEFLSEMASMGSATGDPNQRFTFRRGEDGFYIQQHDAKTRELVGETKWDGNRDALIGRLVKYSSMANYKDATKEEKLDKRNERTDTRDDLRVANQDRQAKEQLRVTEKHYGDVAAASKRANDLAQKAHQLQVDRHGVNSPEAKEAKRIQENNARYDTGLTELAEMRERGDPPEKVLAKARALSEAHPDKMVKATEEVYDPATGMTRKVPILMDPLEARNKPYAVEYAKKEQAQANEAYPKAGIKVIGSPVNGKVAYVSSKGAAYDSLESLVKAEKLKGVTRNTSSTQQVDAAPTAAETQRGGLGGRRTVGTYDYGDYYRNPPATYENSVRAKMGALGLPETYNDDPNDTSAGNKARFMLPWTVPR